MRLSAVHVYPVKSLAGVPVEAAEVLPWGLAGDRGWMLVDGEGTLVSARTARTMLALRPGLPRTDGSLTVTAPDGASVTLTPPSGARVPVRLGRHELRAIPAGEPADAWFRRVLGRDDLRVVWCDEGARRATNPAYSRPGDSVGFADGYPVTLTTTASLARLNDWIVEAALERGEAAPEPLPMQRFRPNLVVDGVGEAFAEDGWTHLRVGAVRLRVVKGIDRCVMTTIDPEDPRTALEPIRTLARHRKWDGVTWFGRQLIPDGPGAVRVGDPVEVLG